MVAPTLVALLAASSHLALGAPTAEPLRLIKTSASDPGQWVTEREKFERFTAKGLGFFDITGVADTTKLSAVKARGLGARQESPYPSALAHVDEAYDFINASSVQGPQSWLRDLTGFFNRHYQSPTGRESADWLFETVQGVAAANEAITVEQFEHSFDQPSIIVRIPGETDNLVILGAHLDSTSGSAEDPAPGADDNGSGTVVVLESLRVLAEAGFAPSNTIELHLYAGEEGGLLGSQDIYAAYAEAGKSVLAFVNMDMAGYSLSQKVAVFTDYTDENLNEFVILLAEEFTGSTPSSAECGYGCSDHASASANGFPAAFVHEDLSANTSPYIHTPDDKYETIMWDAIERHLRLAIGFVIEASYI